MSRQLGPAGWRGMWAKFDRRCDVYWLRKRWTLVLLHDRDVIALFFLIWVRWGWSIIYFTSL